MWGGARPPHSLVRYHLVWNLSLFLSTSAPSIPNRRTQCILPALQLTDALKTPRECKHPRRSNHLVGTSAWISPAHLDQGGAGPPQRIRAHGSVRTLSTPGLSLSSSKLSFVSPKVPLSRFASPALPNSHTLQGTCVRNGVRRAIDHYRVGPGSAQHLCFDSLAERRGLLFTSADLGPRNQCLTKTVREGPSPCEQT